LTFCGILYYSENRSRSVLRDSRKRKKGSFFYFLFDFSRIEKQVGWMKKILPFSGKGKGEKQSDLTD